MVINLHYLFLNSNRLRKKVPKDNYPRNFFHKIIFYFSLAHFKHSYCRLAVAVISSGIIYFTWLSFYDHFVLSGPEATHWYLLDRIFISFLIFGLYGGLSWNFHHEIQTFLFKYWWLIVGIYLLT